MRTSILSRLSLLGAAGLAALGSFAFADTATVDGAGGAATGDATFPTSYATVGAAVTAVNAAAGNHTINITTAGPLDETAFLFDQAKTISIDGATGGTHLRITPAGIGNGGGSVGVAIRAVTGMDLTFNRLVITPGTGVAGPVQSRAIQIYNNANVATTATISMNDVMVTALRPTGHANAGQALTDPFFEYESTRANRNANTRSFSGGSGIGSIDISSGNQNIGGLVTVNMTRSGVCHQTFNAAGAQGGGMAVIRTMGIGVNINGGCFFTFNDVGGFRLSVTMADPASFFKFNGTAANPIVAYRNGWQRDSANTGRNEGIIYSPGTTTNVQALDMDYVYAIQNFQEGIEINNAVATLNNVIAAENQYGIDGAPASVATAANLFVQGAGANVTVTDSTFFDNAGNAANDNAIRWTVGATAALSTTRTIIAGAGDQIAFGAGTRTWTDTDTAVVTAGAHALDGTPVVLNGNTRTSTFSASDDPEFLSTAFSATYTMGTGIAVPTNYLSSDAAGYRASRTSGAADIKGANLGSPLPVELSTFMIE